MRTNPSPRRLNWLQRKMLSVLVFSYRFVERSATKLEDALKSKPHSVPPCTGSRAESSWAEAPSHSLSWGAPLIRSEVTLKLFRNHAQAIKTSLQNRFLITPKSPLSLSKVTVRHSKVTPKSFPSPLWVTPKSPLIHFKITFKLLIRPPQFSWVPLSPHSAPLSPPSAPPPVFFSPRFLPVPLGPPSVFFHYKTNEILIVCLGSLLQLQQWPSQLPLKF